jgi:hypothetical protein
MLFNSFLLSERDAPIKHKKMQRKKDISNVHNFYYKIEMKNLILYIGKLKFDYIR